jgi:hypothetical protein
LSAPIATTVSAAIPPSTASRRLTDPIARNTDGLTRPAATTTIARLDERDQGDAECRHDEPADLAARHPATATSSAAMNRRSRNWYPLRRVRPASFPAQQRHLRAEPLHLLPHLSRCLKIGSPSAIARGCLALSYPGMNSPFLHTS